MGIDWAKTKAQKVWGELSSNERFGVKFGLFPARYMPLDHQVVVALMAIASSFQEKEGGEDDYSPEE